MSERNFSLKSELVFDELGNGMMRVVFNDCGKEQTKLLTMDTYLSILGDATFSNIKNYVRIGSLPEGFLDGSISSEDPATFDVVLIKPAQKRPMIYGNRHWFIPFPKLVFYLSVSMGRVTTKLCFALRNETVDENTPIYLYPFGNVSFDGSICMGNVITKDLNQISMVEEFIADFFMSETNNDYYDNKNQTGLSQAELLYRLKELELFPNEWLQKAGCMRDILKKVKQGG